VGQPCLWGPRGLLGGPWSGSGLHSLPDIDIDFTVASREEGKEAREHRTWLDRISGSEEPMHMVLTKF
jgi:hypothetical protein